VKRHVRRPRPKRADTMLSRQEARRVYDRIGSFQDSQRFYEDRATELLLRHGSFASADAVFEFGCGTGRFAIQLFTGFLSPNAIYRGMDISPRMVCLAQERLKPYSARAEVILTEDGSLDGEASDSCDRFVSNYVFDLLSKEDIRSVLRSARRMLRRAGLLCLAGLSTGTGPASRMVAKGWSWLQARRPAVVGGCRPIDLLPLVSERDWKVCFHQKVVTFGITSEALVAQRQ
jgi:ubiquinone/menaquinone biosynthesis C-methylase UbiE